MKICCKYFTAFVIFYLWNMVMNSDTETILSRQVTTLMHISRFFLLWERGTVPCPLVGMCSGLILLYETSLKEMLKQRLSLQPYRPFHFTLGNIKMAGCTWFDIIPWSTSKTLPLSSLYYAELFSFLLLNSLWSTIANYLLL